MHTFLRTRCIQHTVLLQEIENMSNDVEPSRRPIWQLGCLFYQLSTKDIPYWNVKKIKNASKHGEERTLISLIKEKVKKL